MASSSRAYYNSAPRVVETSAVHTRRRCDAMVNDADAVTMSDDERNLAAEPEDAGSRGLMMPD